MYILYSQWYWAGSLLLCTTEVIRVTNSTVTYNMHNLMHPDQYNSWQPLHVAPG